LLLVLLLVAGVWALSRRGGGEETLEELPSGQAVIVDEEAPLADPTRSAERQVVLFFAREGSDLLHPESRRIFVTASITEQAKQVIEGLIRGPRRALGVPVLPREATLRELYVDREGNAYVDFGADLLERHPGGSDAEIATLFAVVNSLTYNFPQIRSVRILIEGEERDTLAGHIDLRRRYFRDLSRVEQGGLENAGEDEPRASR
jgi:germination protein M